MMDQRAAEAAAEAHELHASAAEAVALAIGSVTMPAEAIPDLRALMPAADSGDENAIGELHKLTQQIISAKVHYYADTGIDIDDIHGTVTEKIFRSAFDPDRPLPDGIPPERAPALILSRYSSYIGAVVRSAAADKIRMFGKERPAGDMRDCDNPKLVEPGARQHYANGDATNVIPADLLQKILSPKQLKIFELVRKDISYPEIAEQVGSEYGAVKGVMQRVIQRLEAQILRPAGLLRVGEAVAASGLDINVASANSAIKSGIVQAVKVLNRWYMKPEWLKPLYVPEDAVPLGDIASAAAMAAFRYKYRDRIIMTAHTVYIRAEDIPLLNEIAENQRRKHIPPPQPGFINIADMDCTANEESMLRQRHFSQTIKFRYRVFVPEAEAAAHLERIRAFKRERALAKPTPHGPPGAKP